MVRRIINNHGRKLLRYAGVSCVGVTAGQLLLFFFYEVVGLRAVLANTAAVAIAPSPRYQRQRAWGWGKNGDHSLTAEIIPLGGMACVGRWLSNLLVHFAEQRSDAWWLINGANFVAFGVVWVAKYVVVDQVLFRHEDEADQAGATDTVASVETV